MSNKDGLDNQVQNEGSKPDVLKERLAGRDQEKMIQDKFIENDEKAKKGEDDNKTITTKIQP